MKLSVIWGSHRGQH